MSLHWVVAPLLSFGSVATLPAEPAAIVGEDQFAATCVDLEADSIDTVGVCVVGLDGSITPLAKGFVPGVQVALSADRTQLAAATDEEVRVLDAAGESVATIPITGATGLAWMPDGESLLVQVVGASQWSVTNVRVGDPADARQVASGAVVDESVRRGITVSPDGTMLLFAEWSGGGDQGSLMSVDVESGSISALHEWDEPISVPDISPDGELVALTVADRIEVIELETGDLVRSVVQDLAVTTPSFSPDGLQLMYVEARGAVEYQDLDDELSERVVIDITDRDDASAFPANPTWN